MSAVQKNIHWYIIIIGVIVVGIIIWINYKDKESRKNGDRDNEDKKNGKKKEKLTLEEISDIEDSINYEIDKRLKTIEIGKQETQRDLIKKSEDLSDTRKGELIEFMSTAHTIINKQWTSSAKIIGEINNLTDSELYYSALAYKKMSGGVSLYTDVKEEILPFTKKDNILLKRLASLEYLDLL